METYRDDNVLDFTLILINGTRLVTQFAFVVRTKVYNVCFIIIRMN